NGAPEGFISFLDFVWLALLFFPMGYWSSTAARAGVGAALVWGVLLTLGITWPAVVTAGDYLAPAAGILGGFLLSRFRARRRPSAGGGGTSVSRVERKLAVNRERPLSRVRARRRGSAVPPVAVGRA